MRLKPEWQQSISTRGFWVAVALVILLLVGMGTVFLATGHIPQIPLAAEIGLFLFVLAVHLLRLITY